MPLRGAQFVGVCNAQESIGHPSGVAIVASTLALMPNEAAAQRGGGGGFRGGGGFGGGGFRGRADLAVVDLECGMPGGFRGGFAGGGFRRAGWAGRPWAGEAGVAAGLGMGRPYCGWLRWLGMGRWLGLSVWWLGLGVTRMAMGWGWGAAGISGTAATNPMVGIDTEHESRRVRS